MNTASRRSGKYPAAAARSSSPIPKPRKRKGKSAQEEMAFDEGKGLSTTRQQYEASSAVITDLRYMVDQWRALKKGINILDYSNLKC
jgi:hypothetical protein